MLETEDFANKLFKFFPNWVTKYEIGGISHKGESYQHEDFGMRKLNEIFPLKGKSVIEMGSQEAAHSKIVHDFGARKIVGLEGRLENYIKCCIIKNIFNLSNAKFFLEDLRTVELEKFGSFDVCLCSGVLYHLLEPQELISKISKISPRILINTHYGNEAYPTFGKKDVILNGKKYRANLQDEDVINSTSTGLQNFSVWLFKDDLVQLLKDVGYDKVHILKDWYLEKKIPEQQSITIFAEKSKSNNP